MLRKPVFKLKLNPVGQDVFVLNFHRSVSVPGINKKEDCLHILACLSLSWSPGG